MAIENEKASFRASDLCFHPSTMEQDLTLICVVEKLLLVPISYQQVKNPSTKISVVV
jgi:hypothetical protein